jgi:uncharacterized protein (TIGR03437 family)
VKRLWLVSSVCLVLALFGSLGKIKTSTAQTTPADEVAIIQLTTPTNAVGVNIRSVSNDGKRFVFDSINDYDGTNIDSNREIFVFEVDSKTVIQLTDTKDVTETAADGTIKTVRRLTSNTPIISGDGTKIVFTSNAKLTGTANDEGNQEIYLIDFPRTATKRSDAVVTQLTDTGPNTDVEVINEIFTNYAPTINDDGSRIAFVSTRRTFRALANGTPAFTAVKEGANSDLDPDGNGEIFVYNAAAKRYSQVTATRDTDSIVNFVVRGFNNNPNLSGDGQRLAFLSGFNFAGAAANKNTDFNGEIFLHNVGEAINTVRQITDTTGAPAVPAGGVMNTLPAFVRPLNRTGSLLVFESAGDFAGKNSEKLREVFLADVSATTTTFRQVTDQTTVDVNRNDFNYLPSINSPGTFITFGSTLNLTPATTSSVTADNADGSREVFRYNIATSTVRQITFTPGSNLTFDQRTQTVPSYADNEGNAINFSLESDLIAPALTFNPEAFRALVFPITGQNSQTPAIVNAASYDNTQVARASIVAAFGTQLAPSTIMAQALPLPVELGGVRVTVAGIAAELIFVSPTQINFVLPGPIAPGDAVPYRINNNGLQAAGTIKLVDVAPGLFSVTGDGKGMAIAQCGRVSDDGLNFEVSAPPCATGNSSNDNLLVLYGTGWRNGAGITVAFGDLVLTPSYAGPQPNYPGLDQINVSIPKELADKANTEFTVNFGTLLSNKLTTSFGAFEEGFTVANAASFEGGFVARGSLALATGEMLANDTVDGISLGYPTELNGVKVMVGGKLARLSYISPTQINFILPDDLATADLVAVDILNNGKRFRGRVGVRGASAGLFTTAGTGDGTVTAKCGKRNADGTATLSDPPCAVGTAEAPNFLRLIGTGWRFAEKTTDAQTVAPVIVSIGGTDLTPTFAGAQPNGSGGTVLGIDQIDVNLTTELAGKTGQDVVIKTTDKKGDKSSKAGVTISFQ